MKTYTKKELDLILLAHGKWLAGEEGGERADLRGANLCGANLWSCVGNRNEMKSLFISEDYPITYTSDHLQIGCKRHRIDDWFGFDDQRISEMDGETALTFWRKYKDFIRSAIELSPATATGHE